MEPKARTSSTKVKAGRDRVNEGWPAARNAELPVGLVAARPPCVPLEIDVPCRRWAHFENAPDRGRSLGPSPSAACRPAEADRKKSVLWCLAKRCEPGRFAVRRGSIRMRPSTRRISELLEHS